MAAPSAVTTSDLSGRFRMSKTLTDNFDPMLAIQGMPWILRKAITLATVTLHIKQYTSEPDEKVHIDIDQFVTGGINAGPENRTLDWVEHGKKDNIFGDVKGKNRFVRISELTEGEGVEDAEWLSEGWDDGKDGLRVQGYSWNEKEGWTANQIWGFQLIDGTRYYCRKCVVRKGGERIQVRFVYEYLGPPK